MRPATCPCPTAPRRPESVPRSFLLALIASSFVAAPAWAARVEGFGWSIDVPARCAKRVKVSEVAANPTYDGQATAELKRDPMAVLKPDFANMPAHVRFDLTPCFGDGGFGTSLRVLPRVEFESILDVPGETRRMLADDFVRLSQWIASGKSLPRWPFLPFVDVSRANTSAAQRVDFDGGRGMRVLTMFTVDDYMTRPDAFDYAYQGLSARGGCYVLMMAPVRIPSFADAEAQKRGLDWETAWRDPGALRGYADLVRREIEAPGFVIQPELATLDAVVQSLQGRCDADWTR
jgi:hypothetical protein